MFKSFSDDEGFTLIELLVVILIIAILVAVALPNFLGQQNKAKDSAEVQRLAVAYKAAKSGATTADRNGSYKVGATAASSATAVAADIDASEGAGTALTTALPASSDGKVHVVVDYSTDTLTLNSRSKSGASCTLVAPANGGLTTTPICS